MPSRSAATHSACVYSGTMPTHGCAVRRHATQTRRVPLAFCQCFSEAGLQLTFSKPAQGGRILVGSFGIADGKLVALPGLRFGRCCIALTNTGMHWLDAVTPSKGQRPGCKRRSLPHRFSTSVSRPNGPTVLLRRGVFNGRRRPANTPSCIAQFFGGRHWADQIRPQGGVCNLFVGSCMASA
jgi:hypothetical protein